ncbi:hypothetical protein JR316_0006147 [Psilocybe cubensis]|uniref:Uncharacterized protein n=1 Tax=Psilocybe cubensis TaxID=181762 RepID=A0ACB8H1M0_PSICU|nr:hypothetical protein JR316_0006147 [Psilocybe cubensis]KAH9481620.1 hypothetical protein JR316_0006147 [Psilocybe cubensis]
MHCNVQIFINILAVVLFTSAFIHLIISIIYTNPTEVAFTTALSTAANSGIAHPTLIYKIAAFEPTETQVFVHANSMRHTGNNQSQTTPNNKGKGKAKAVDKPHQQPLEGPAQNNDDSYQNDIEQATKKSKKKNLIRTERERKAATSSAGVGPSSQTTSPVRNFNTSRSLAIGHREETNTTDVFAPAGSTTHSPIQVHTRDNATTGRNPSTLSNPAVSSSTQQYIPPPYNDEDSISPDTYFEARRAQNEYYSSLENEPLYTEHISRSPTPERSAPPAPRCRPQATLRPASHQPVSSNSDNEGRYYNISISSSPSQSLSSIAQSKMSINTNWPFSVPEFSLPPSSPPSTDYEDDEDYVPVHMRQIAPLPVRRSTARPAVAVPPNTSEATPNPSIDPSVPSPAIQDEYIEPAQRPIAALPRRHRIASVNQALLVGVSNSSVVQENSSSSGFSQSTS